MLLNMRRYGVGSTCVVLLAGCFFSSPSQKKIAGDYCLEKWPRGFIVVGCSFRAKLHGETDNGPLDGNVLRIGWNDHLIIAQRKAVVGGSVAWMILDTKPETLEGPFTDVEFEEKVRANPELGAIDLKDVASAWDE